MVSTYIKAIFLVVLLALFNGCEEDKMDVECGPRAITTEEFDIKPSDQFIISSAELEGQCLAIEFGASGCSGESWSTELLMSEVTTFSIPPQVGLRLILDNDELCEAFITKTYYFDLSALDVFGASVIIELEGWDESISYLGSMP